MIPENLVNDIMSKPLLLVGGRRSGKTVMTKHLVDRLNHRDKIDLKVFDVSLAWWRNSPLAYRQFISDTWVVNRSNCLYELGGLHREARKAFVTQVIGGEYAYRYSLMKDNPTIGDTVNQSIVVLEEAQSLLEKMSRLPDEMHDWVSVGRNFKMSGVLTTQRPAELDTKIVERCNLLVGYCEGDNNLSKIRSATSRDFYNQVKRIPQGSFQFLYYNGYSDEYNPIKADDVKYPDPLDVAVTAPVEEKKSLWDRIFK